MHMISFQNYRESGDKVQDDVITTKHILSHTMRVDTAVQHKNVIMINEYYNGYNWNH